METVVREWSVESGKWSMFGAKRILSISYLISRILYLFPIKRKEKSP